MKLHEVFNLIVSTSYKKTGIDVDYCVKEVEGIPCLLFKESNSKIDWKTNFHFWKKPYKNQENTMLVHSGFANAWKSANDVIMKEFIDLVNKKKATKVLITGWSFGGAMSYFAAEDFNYRTGLKPDVITFGAPKIVAPFAFKSRKHIASAINNLQNVTHKADIVTKIPPFFIKFKRLSVGKFSLKLFFTGKGHTLYGEESLYK